MKFRSANRIHLATFCGTCFGSLVALLSIRARFLFRFFEH